MFDKKKLNFWRLAVIFIGFTGITLAALWLSPQTKMASMMNESMANMASMHLTNATIYDIAGVSDAEKTSSGSQKINQSKTADNSEHHENGSSEVKTMGIVTTVIIFTLLPLLIFGTIILSIVWIK